MKQTGLAILRTVLGSQAEFRDGQWEAIAAIVEQRQKTVVVQRTGWGKSLVYFVATLLNQRQQRGMTVLISPLLSLMRNQIEQAHKFGLRANRMDSTNYAEHSAIEADLLRGTLDLLIISPERLANAHFRATIWSEISLKVGLLVIDEVHCISDWGHDFRPDYRRVLHIMTELRAGTPILGTTATANTRVIQDVKEILGGDVIVSRGSLMRDSLRLYVYPEIQSSSQRLVLLSHLLRRIEGSGIIYCTTTRDCDLVSLWLQQEGFEVEAYHSKVQDNREHLEEKLLNNRVKALVASVALGMGFDKPDLTFVIHYQLPGSIIAYYQQIGRAGRGMDNAHVILMRGEEDREIQEYFIKSAFPSISLMEQAAQLASQQGTITFSDVVSRLNTSYGTAEKILQHLEIEGFLQYTENGYVATQHSLPDFDRWALISQQRYDELDEMEAYAVTEKCLMQVLAQTLEDPTHPQPCGRCKNCLLSKSSFAPTTEQLRRAETFLLHGEPIWIEPRKQWPARNIITPKAKLEHINARGMALCNYNSEGWGKLVKHGKYTTGQFDEVLVQASAELIREHLDKQFEWITNIPSKRHPTLVATFASKLAAALSVPYIPCVTCNGDIPQQKLMQNSHAQVANIAHAFTIHAQMRRSAVLLVDDIIDSGWSLTMVGWQLRNKGVATVIPFVLAKATGSL